MSLSFGQTVTILRDVPGGVDQWNDPVPASTSRTDIAGCAVHPRYSTEPTAVGRNGVVIGQTILAPYGSDILFTDRIEIAGVVYLVEGEGGNWKSVHTGTEFGMEIAIKRAVG